MKNLCLVTITAFLLLGCGKGLSRDQAGVLIQQALDQQPRRENYRTYYDQNVYSWDAAPAVFLDKIPGLARARKLGLVKVESLKAEKSRISDSMTFMELRLSLTDSGAALARDSIVGGKEVIVSRFKLSGVTGIASVGETRVATFSWTEEFTGFGEVLGLANAPRIGVGRAEFLLFDDGWRINDWAFQ